MTGREQQAATVRDGERIADELYAAAEKGGVMWSQLACEQMSRTVHRLVALAGRVDELEAEREQLLAARENAYERLGRAIRQREDAEARVISVSEYGRKRAEAAEARADELQRERDEALDALDECGKTLLSQTEAFETHLGRQVATEEEPCSTAARGSEDTPSTPATAPADAPSSATEASSTSTPKADASTASAGKGTSASPATSGSDGSAELEQARREAVELRAALRDAVDVAVWLTGLGEIPVDSAWPEMREKLNKAIALAGVQADTCDHDWKDMRNADIESGEWCPKCGAIRPGNVQADSKDAE